MPAPVKRPTKTLRRQFGALFRQARNDAGLTQSEVQAATGVHKGHISEIERGLQNPTAETMDALAGAVGMIADISLRPVPPRKPRSKTQRAKHPTRQEPEP